MRPEDLDDYRNWLTREHIADRTRLPGFLGVRLFDAADDETSHFILYATANAGVFASPAYVSVLDNPSPWTRRIMPRFGPFDRAAGAQLMKVGNGFGACIAVSRLDLRGEAPDPEDWHTLLTGLRLIEGVVGARLFEVEHDTTDIMSEEKAMRSGREGNFRYLLCVEAMSRTGAKAAARAIGERVGAGVPGVAVRDVSVRRMIYGESPHETQTSGPG